MALLKTLSLGKLTLASNILCAPLAGCSDQPFRKIACLYKPGLVFCEMVKIDALVRRHQATMRFLDYTPDMHPIGAQLCGSKPAMAGDAAKIVEDLGFDVIDLNCGCPVDKVTKDGSGSALLRRPELIGEIVSAIVSAVKIPVTVKIRTGWDGQHIEAPAITQIVEQAGAVAITVHGRTRQQGYKGAANWDHIRDCKQAARKILVIGNGDVVDGASAERLLVHTECDGVLVARGMLGKPWVIEDIARHLSGLPPIVRTEQEMRKVLLEHFRETCHYSSERQALLDIRRIGCWYLKSCHHAKSLRMAINGASQLSEVWELLEDTSARSSDF